MRPGNDEAPGVGAPRGLGKHDYSATDSALASAESKRLSTARARAALASYELRESADDAGRPLYVVSRWTLCRHFAGPNALFEFERWLDQAVGAR